MPENKKLLLIEDDNMISSMYKTKLEQDKYLVTCALNGLDGLTAAQGEKFDLILLDVIMPQLDGFAVLEELKGNDKTKNTPVIMLTNLGTDEDKQKGKKLGAIGYLIKSNMTPSQVSSEIKKILKN